MSRSFGDLITEEEYNKRKMKALKKVDSSFKEKSIKKRVKRKKKEEEKPMFRGLSSTNKTNRGPLRYWED